MGDSRIKSISRNSVYWGYIGDNGKSNGNYYNGAYIRIIGYILGLYRG